MGLPGKVYYGHFQIVPKTHCLSVRALPKRDFLLIKEFKETLCKKLAKSNSHYHNHNPDDAAERRTDMVPLFVEASFDFPKIRHALIDVFLVESQKLLNFPLTIRNFLEGSEGLWWAHKDDAQEHHRGQAKGRRPAQDRSREFRVLVPRAWAG